MLQHKSGYAGERPNACCGLYGESASLWIRRFSYSPVCPRRINPGSLRAEPSKAYAASLSAKNIIIWLYAIGQSLGGSVHFLVISFTERKTTFRIESSVGNIDFVFVYFRTIL
jgi:hypothetical protein